MNTTAIALSLAAIIDLCLLVVYPLFARIMHRLLTSTAVDRLARWIDWRFDL